MLAYDEHGEYTSENSIAIIWCIDDVRTVIKDHEKKVELTDDECMEVLNYCLNEHDANYGMSWDSISWAIDHLKNKGGTETC